MRRIPTILAAVGRLGLTALPAILLLLGAAGCSGSAERVGPSPELTALGAPVPLPDDPYRQFDFWLGEWDVQNWQLRDGKWGESGRARALVQPVVDGGAVLEQWRGTVGGDPLIGFSLRAYDADLGEWVVYLNWHGGRPAGFSAMHGVRDGERMELFPPSAADSMRYTFSEVREGSCRWDSSRSEDGTEWVTDWIMHFTRRAPPVPLDAASAVVRQPPDGAAQFPETRRLDFLIGAWEGRARRLLADGGWEEGTARALVTSMIEGLGLMQLLDTSWGEKTFAGLGYDTRAGGWVAIRADNRSDGLRRMRGEPAADAVRFTSDPGPELLRESWFDCGEDACRWERAVSRDGGASWDGVLQIDFRRAGPS